MQALRRATPDLVIMTLLFVLPLVFFLPQTLGGRTLIPTENLFQYEPYASAREAVNAPARPHNHLVSDLILQNYQWKSFIRQQLADGEVPLWNPHQLGGIPFLAAGQASTLYPLSVIYYVLPLWLAYGWFTVINLWLAGVFMYLFARGLGIGRTGAMLSGIIYQFAGFVLASVVFQMMIGAIPWLPLMLLMIEYIIRRRKLFGYKTTIPWVAIGATALAMNVLAGHVEITIYCLLISGFYAGARLLHDSLRVREMPAMFKQAGWLITMIVLGIGLAAIQFLPLYDFVQINWRAERSEYAAVVDFAHPARDVLQFALPNFFGNPTHHQIYDVFEMQWVENWATDTQTYAPQTHTEWGIKNYVESALYLGILPLLLAIYAVIDRTMWTMQQNGKIMEVFMREPPYRAIFGTMALLSLTFMFGLPTYRLIYSLPGINQLNSPFRWIFGLTVAVAVMAGFGLDALQRRAAETHTRAEVRTGYGLIAIALLVFVGLAGSYIAYPNIEAQITTLMMSLAQSGKAFGEGTTSLFYSYQFANVAVFATMLLLSGIVFVWVGRMRMYKNVNLWGSFALAVVIADLMIASWGFNPASDPLLLDYTPQPIEWLQERYEADGAFRYTTLEPPNTLPILNANVTMQYGLDDIRGYDSIIPLSYVEYMRETAPQVQLDFNRIAPITMDASHYAWHPQPDYVQVLDSSLLALLNVRYIVTYPDVLIPFQDWQAVCCDNTVVIYENPLAVPRAYTVALDDMTLPIGDFIYPDGITDFEIPDYTPATVLSDSGREKLVDLALNDDSWLVYSENYLDGWKAFIRPEGIGEENEFQLEVAPVAGMFQGVQIVLDDVQAYYAERDLSPDAQAALDGGRFTLRLVYSPTSVQVGFFGSAIAAIVLTLLIGMWLWTVFVGTNTDDSSQTAKVARNSVAPIILNLFNRGIDFVFAIVLYRLLSQEMVGVYNFAVVIFVWFDIFTNFGLDLFLMREVSKDRTQSGFYLFNTSFFRFFLSIIGFGLLIIFLLIWQNTVEPLPSAGLIALVLLYIGLFPASLNKGMTSLYYAHEQAEKPAAIATITTINKAIFGVIVLLMGWGIIGLAAVSIANNFITLGVLIWAGRSFITDLPKKPDFSKLREMISESYPLMLNHFLATIFFQIDIVILQAIKGSITVAQYSTSYKWLLALNIVPSFFTQALFPLMSRQAENDKAQLKQTYRFGIKLMVAIALPLAVGFTALANVLTLILAGASYLPNGAIALTIMIWSIPIGWMNSLTQYALIALGLQRYITWAFFIAVTFNIVSNIIFIPIYGFAAAAVTTILSEAALLVPFAILMHRGLGERINWLSLIWRPIVATFTMIVVTLVLIPVNLILALLIASMTYLVVLLSLKPLDAGERAIIAPMLPERLKRLPFFKLS
ncbi:MAG: oligosaccharide flippase family protein [Phototrophicaceae bacterium]